jgi:glycerophosphoryl diester phosphodiesterase
MWQTSSIPFLKNSRPLIMAHRGDSANVPENTLQAFEDAYKLGVDCIETDVRLTKDNHFIFFHDSKIDRTTNQKGKVSDYTLAELKKMDAGYQFPGDEQDPFPYRAKGLQVQTIDEIVPKFPNVRFNMDIKDRNPIAPQLLTEKLKELGVEDRVMVGSFHQSQIIKFRELSDVPTSAGIKEFFKFWRKSKKYIRSYPSIYSNPSTGVKLSQEDVFGTKLPYFALQIPEKIIFLKFVTPEFIKFAHLIEISVQVWTINERKDMQRLLDWGVDGIFTDKPKILMDILNPN